MAPKQARASRRIAYRLQQAERAVRDAAALLADAVQPSDLERDREGLLLLAGLLGEAADAYTPAKRWPNARKGG